MGILVTAYWLKKATIFQLCPWFVVSYCTWLAINAIMYFHTTKHVVSLMLCLPFWVEFVWRYVPSSVCKQTSKNWNGDNHCLRILHETFVKNFDLSGFVSYFADFFLLHCRIAVLTFESVRICKAEKRSVFTWWPFFKAKMLLHFLLIFHSKILGLNVCITSLPVEEKQIQVSYFPCGFHFLNWVVIIMRWSKTLLTYILHVRPKLLIFDWGVLCVKNLSFVIDWQCKHLFRYHEKWLQVPN